MIPAKNIMLKVATNPPMFTNPVAVPRRDLSMKLRV
jgi:hypothetical protein